MNALDNAHQSFQSGNLEDAYRYCDQAVETEPENAKAYALWGKVSQAQINYEEALKHYQKASELAPDKAQYRFKIADLLLLQGQYPQAEAFYRPLLESELSQNAWLFCNLGRSLLYQGKLDEASVYLHRAIELSPELAEAHVSLGRVLTKQQRFAEATPCYQKAIELNPSNFLDYHELGDNYLLQKEYEPAILAYKSAINLHPSYFWSHLNLGKTLSLLKRWKDATLAFQATLQLNNNCEEAYTKLGDILLNLGRGEEAIDLYRKALNLERSSSDVLYLGLGKILTNFGYIDEGLKTYQKALQLFPNHQEIQERYTMLQDNCFLSPQIQSINEWNHDFQPIAGTSIFTCCMNRNSNLKRAVKTWLQCKGIDEIVILDWNSSDLVASTLAEMNDTRIVIVRVENQEKWILSHAFNLAARLTTRSKLIKLDADIEISPDFLKKNILQENTFLAGNWKSTEADQAYINGCFYLHRTTFMTVNGFNEWIKTYGWDDTDLYQRLEERGYNRIDLDSTTLIHMKHSDRDRLAYQFRESSEYGYDRLRQLPQFNNQKNRFIAFTMPDWNLDRQMLDFQVRKQNSLNEGVKNYFIAQQKHDSYHQVPEFIISDAEAYTAREILCWRLGFEALKLNNLQLEQLIQRKKIESISKFDLFLWQYIKKTDTLKVCSYSVILDRSNLKENQLIYCIYMLLLLTNKVRKNLCIRESLLTDKVWEFINFLSNPRMIILPDHYPVHEIEITLDIDRDRLDINNLSIDANLIINLDRGAIDELASQDILDDISRKLLVRYDWGNNTLKFLAYEDLKYSTTIYKGSIQKACQVSDLTKKLENIKYAIRFAPFQNHIECYDSICEAVCNFADEKIDEFQTVKDWLWQQLTYDYKPLVTIVTSMFEGDEYIEEFLADMTRQTMFGRCELVLINPNSPGNEEPIIKKYMERFENIKYKRLDYDPGLYDCWNMAIMMGSGEYITNANLDDRRAPQHLEVLVSSLEAHPDVDVASSALYVTYGKNERWEDNTAHDAWFIDFSKFYDASSLFVEKNGEIESQNIAHCMPVWRRKLHERFGFFDEHTYGTSCDWEFWLRCGSQGIKFMLIDQPLGLYLENPVSHNRRFSNKHVLEQKIVNKYYQPLKEGRNV